MSININTNLSSRLVQKSLRNSTSSLNQAIERMTTGFRINSAKDDAANFAISTKMSSKITSYQVAEDNVAMGMDMISTASGVLAQAYNNAQRLRDLALQARNEIYGEQSLRAIQDEANAIAAELERLCNGANYNGMSLFNRTEYDIPAHLPKAGNSGFIDESSLSDYALRRDKDDLFIDNPVTYTQAEVEAMSSIDNFDSTKTNKYKITSAEDLAKLADIVNSGTSTYRGTFVLACDIDLSEWCAQNGNWIPIGDYSTDTNNVFQGTFDGNGHTISNLKIDASDKDYQGLFGRGRNIQNVALTNVDISGNNYTGGLVGQGTGTITNCHVSGKVNGSGNYIGGMVGYQGTIKQCNTDVYVTGTGNYYGGLVGYGSVTDSSYALGDINVNGGYVGGLHGGAGRVTNCYATGNVTATGTRCGSLSGSCGTIKNSYATGDIYCTSAAVGGLVGESWGGNGLIENCFSTGNVYGKGSTGGLIGWNESTVKNCYSLSQVESTGSAGGLIGWFNVKNTQSVEDCVSFGDVVGTIGVGGLIGDLDVQTDSLTVNLENNKTYSNVTGNKLVGSLIGKIRITSDEISYGNVNISDCQDRAQDVPKIGGATKGGYTTPISYDLTPMLDGITNVMVKDTNITLQVGINSSSSSRLLLDTKFDFDISAIPQDISSDEALLQIDEFLSSITSKQTELGAVSNRLESILDAIGVQYTNLVSSNSTIKDADITVESSRFIKAQILQQASATLLATANQSPSIALQLI